MIHTLHRRATHTFHRSRHWRCVQQGLECSDQPLFWSPFLRICSRFGRFGLNCEGPVHLGPCGCLGDRGLCGPLLSGCAWTGWTIGKSTVRVHSLRRGCRDCWRTHCPSIASLLLHWGEVGGARFGRRHKGAATRVTTIALEVALTAVLARSEGSPRSSAFSRGAVDAGRFFPALSFVTVASHTAGICRRGCWAV